MSKLKRVESVLFFLTLLFLPTQLGKHFWPDFSYIYSLKIDYLSPTLYFWDILVVGLLIVWISRKPVPKRAALNIFLFFLLTQILSLPTAANIGAGLVRLQQYVIVGLFGVFLASLDSKSLSKKIFLPLALGILGEAVIAILQFSRGSTLGFWILGERTFALSTPGIAKFDFYGNQFLRPYATFPHPNVLAGYLLIIAVLINRKWKAAVSLFAAIAIFLTMSRTAILAGVTMLPFLLKRKWLVVMVVLLLVLSPVLFTRFSAIFNFDNLTLLRREELLVDAWQVFLKNPWFGVGLNNFIPTMAFQLTSGPNRFLQPVHNIFLLVLSETGVIGIAGFVCLIGLPIFRLFKLHLRPFSPHLFLPWFIILFLGMFDHYFLTLPQGYRIFFLVWGISLSFL